MPLYEYQCKKCKHKFEKIQKFSDRAIRKCPE
ncbi:MAG TPA: zinc ribbon domain-containing protein, partial [Alphaproteobacteria bacterium]|nr:zinc ribbon domain-containing protein [Alphaproteobacteria bacterium]